MTRLYAGAGAHAVYEPSPIQAAFRNINVGAQHASIDFDTSAEQYALMRLGALNWGTFFQAHPDTPGKLAAFAYAFEHLEIGGYELLVRVATRAGDDETVRVANTILGQERAAATKIASLWDVAADASLRETAVAV